MSQIVEIPSFLPLHGREKKILSINLDYHPIIEIPSYPPAMGGGKRYYQLIWTTTQNKVMSQNS
ncbi:MAG: hypothetical protein LBR79_03590 [Oscillospiraceae bacterium]|jgi:hypothetical protein|nr:hypothetical protein [Oscillospiraceae bacterium]